MKVIITILFFLCLSHSNLIGQTTTTDSIFLSIDKNEKAFVKQEMRPGMTLYQLSRSYDIPVQLLLDFNPHLQIDDIPIGSQIRIPFEILKERLFPTQSDNQDRTAIVYKVRPKENMYRISKVYLGLDIKTVMQMNHLKRKGLDIDQVLVAGYLDKGAIESTIPPLEIDDTQVVIVKPDGSIFTIDSSAIAILDSVREMRTPFDIYEEEHKTIRRDRGVAFWDKTQYEKKNLYVLHTSARKNSLVEITNPMNGRKIYAKVVGNIPSKSYTKDIKMVVSPAVADALRVLDSRFYISYRYIE